MKLKKLCSRCGKSLKNKHLQPPVDTFPARFGRRQPEKMIGFEAETANPISKTEMNGMAVSCSKKITEKELENRRKQI